MDVEEGQGQRKAANENPRAKSRRAASGGGRAHWQTASLTAGSGRFVRTPRPGRPGRGPVHPTTMGLQPGSGAAPPPPLLFLPLVLALAWPGIPPLRNVSLPLEPCDGRDLVATSVAPGASCFRPASTSLGCRRCGERWSWYAQTGETQVERGTHDAIWPFVSDVTLGRLCSYSRSRPCLPQPVPLQWVQLWPACEMRWLGGASR